jgi:D-alanyl-D-alanine carboxypeptidase
VTEAGETLLDNLSDMEFNPASVSKLVTAFGAIKTFGIDYRFATKFLSDGKLDESTGVLNGNLYVDGNDPDFDRTDALTIRQALAEAGIKRVNGKLIVSQCFSYGSVSDPGWSARSLLRVWGSRGGERITVARGTAIGKPPQDAEPLYKFESEPFKQTLKEMLSFSQNNVAEQIGRCAGGVQKLEGIVTSEAGLEPGSLKLASASGLGKNRVKPKDMLLVLKALRTELQHDGLDLQDICPVAGVDPGTLDERFTDPSERGSVVGKTGTLPGTDGGASALAGMFRTQKDNVYFVIFCWRGSVNSFRKQQDELIRRIQAVRGGPKQFEYRALSQDDGV